jgi:hypothetical protein
VGGPHRSGTADGEAPLPPARTSAPGDSDQPIGGGLGDEVVMVLLGQDPNHVVVRDAHFFLRVWFVRLYP